MAKAKPAEKVEKHEEKAVFYLDEFDNGNTFLHSDQGKVGPEESARKVHHTHKGKEFVYLLWNY